MNYRRRAASIGVNRGTVGRCIAPSTSPRNFALFSEHWSPKVVARLNDDEIKLVRIKGEFVWHGTLWCRGCGCGD
jgi:hypothetical protein